MIAKFSSRKSTLRFQIMQKVLAAIGAAVAGVMIYANLPTRLTLPFRQMDVKNLSKALLLNFDNRDKFEVSQ